jgi:fructose-1,6-bisphosphatase/inositol monophosphatase family enzyme
MNKEQVHTLLDHYKKVISGVIEDINVLLEEKLDLGVIHPAYKNINNVTRKIDERIHKNYVSIFKRELGASKIIIEGEEASPPVTENAGTDGNFAVSIDAIDGTDLLSRGFYNWATALFFYIPDSHVFASIIGVPSSRIGKNFMGVMKEMPSGTVYYASNEGAYKLEFFHGEPKTTKLSIPRRNRATRLKDASLCFYGQKASNFLSLSEKPKFIEQLRKLEMKSKDQKMNFRLYNLAGNPMMVKLPDGSVDAVLEIKGQKLYDVVPGAYIAYKAGAYWGDLQGNRIDDKYLTDNGYLSDAGRNKRLSYILASSKALYDEILDMVR